jgi:hypothetical protein
MHSDAVQAAPRDCDVPRVAQLASRAMEWNAKRSTMAAALLQNEKPLFFPLGNLQAFIFVFLLSMDDTGKDLYIGKRNFPTFLSLFAVMHASVTFSALPQTTAGRVFFFKKRKSYSLHINLLDVSDIFVKN